MSCLSFVPSLGMVNMLEKGETTNVSDEGTKERKGKRMLTEGCFRRYR
jgi:hypothetical protein